MGIETEEMGDTDSVGNALSPLDSIGVPDETTMQQDDASSSIDASTLITSHNGDAFCVASDFALTTVSVVSASDFAASSSANRPVGNLSYHELHNVAQYLYKLLDDIDSQSDVCKGDTDAYYRRVNKIQQWKERTVAHNDGYTIVFQAIDPELLTKMTL